MKKVEEKSPKRTLMKLSLYAVTGAIIAKSLNVLKTHKDDIAIALNTNDVTTSIFHKDKGEEIASIVEKMLKENKAFQEELASLSLVPPNDYFFSSLTSYFREYGEFYSPEQIMRFTTGLKEMERYDVESTYIDLLYYAITGEEGVTNSFAYSYAYSIIFNYCREYPSYKGLNGTFEKLIAYLPSDEVASYIISNDIEGLKNALKECYSLEDTKKLDMLEFFYKEYAIASHKEDEIRLTYIREEIKRIEKSMLTSKLEKDAEFKDTFSGQIALQNVNGEEDYFHYIYSETDKKDRAYISGEFYHGLSIQDIEPDAKINYQTAIHIQAIKDLSRANSVFSTELSFLLDPEDFSPYPNIIISNLINKYPNCFQSIEEAEEFIVALSGNNFETIEKYLQILEQKWKTVPISIELVAEVKAFEEYIYSYIRFDYYDNTIGDFDNWHYYIDEKGSKLAMIAKEDEEAQNYEVFMKQFTHPWIWDTLLTFINNMKDYLNEYSEDFTYIENNPYTNRNVKTLEKELAPKNEINVYSKGLGPQIIYKEGRYITFVNIPSNYEKGTLCYQTENIFGLEMKKEIPFLISENEDGFIAIISIDEESPSIALRDRRYYFKTTYDYISKEDKMNLKLTNEDI